MKQIIPCHYDGRRHPSVLARHLYAEIALKSKRIFLGAASTSEPGGVKARHRRREAEKEISSLARQQRRRPAPATYQRRAASTVSAENSYHRSQAREAGESAAPRLAGAQRKSAGERYGSVNVHNMSKISAMKVIVAGGRNQRKPPSSTSRFSNRTKANRAVPEAKITSPHCGVSRLRPYRTKGVARACDSSRVESRIAAAKSSACLSANISKEIALPCGRLPLLWPAAGGTYQKSA